MKKIDKLDLNIKDGRKYFFSISRNRDADVVTDFRSGVGGREGWDLRVGIKRVALTYIYYHA